MTAAKQCQDFCAASDQPDVLTLDSKEGAPVAASAGAIAGPGAGAGAAAPKPARAVLTCTSKAKR